MSSRRELLRSGLRRLALLIGGLVTGTGLVSLVVGALAGADLGRAVSVGYYAVGSLALVGGFFVGNRGPARGGTPPGGRALAERPGRGGARPAQAGRRGGTDGLDGVRGALWGGGLLGRRELRWARPEEQEEALALSALFVVAGLVLVLVGLAIDPRVSIA